MQHGHAVHRAAALDITRKGHPAEHVADGTQGPLRRLVEEGRHLCLVAGDKEESLPSLRQAAQLPAIMRRLCDGIAVMPQHRADPIEQVTPSTGDARHVLEDDQLGRVILERL